LWTFASDSDTLGALQAAGDTGTARRVVAGFMSEGSAMQRTISFTVNGQSHNVTTDPNRPLLDVLREDLGLTGAKFGCGERQCGACTVLVNGRPTFSCATRVATANNRTIETIEGLSDGNKLHPLQEAFLAESALQCGYCTTGMIMSAVALLREKPKPTEDEIRSAMDRNVCRCGTHLRIMRAVARAAEAGSGNGGQSS
jgi:aerobic-type carbon monoxide dehydrogenase small subunit (CoxS/CutS family)